MAHSGRFPDGSGVPVRVKRVSSSHLSSAPGPDARGGSLPPCNPTSAAAATAQRSSMPSAIIDLPAFGRARQSNDDGRLGDLVAVGHEGAVDLQLLTGSFATGCSSDEKPVPKSSTLMPMPRRIPISVGISASTAASGCSRHRGQGAFGASAGLDSARSDAGANPECEMSVCPTLSRHVQRSVCSPRLLPAL